MTIEPRDRFVATTNMQNGFVTTFKVTAIDEVRVIHGDMGEVFPTVTLTPDGFATITFQSDLNVGEYVTAYRATKLDSSDIFVDGQPLRAASLNAEHERVSMLLEDMAMHVSDAIHKPKHDVDISLELPVKEQRVNKVLGFDGAGDMILQPDGYTQLSAVQTLKENVEAIQIEVEAARDTAVAGAQAAASVAWQVMRVTAADSPVTATAGRLYACNTSGGDIVIHFPSIAVVGEPTDIAVQKETGDANTITLLPSGSDLIAEGTSFVVNTNATTSFHADIDTTPDNWQAVSMGGKNADAIIDSFIEGTDFAAGSSNQISLTQSTLKQALQISFDGIVQHHSEWTLSNNIVTFNEVIPAEIKTVEAQYFVTTEIGIPADASVTSAKLLGPMFAAWGSDNDGVFTMATHNNFICTPVAPIQLDFTVKNSGQTGLIWLDNSAGVVITKNTANSILSDEDFLSEVSEAGQYLLSYASPDGVKVCLTNSGSQS